jgi:hypothetical protein
MIPLADCKDRRVYRLQSRNLDFGVFRAATGGFIGLREKFGDRYLFEELHRGDGGGTASPLEELAEELPVEIPLREGLGSVCQTCGVACDYVRWPEGGEREIALESGGTMKVPGQWQHLQATECVKVRAVGKSNTAFFDWLDAVEKRHARQP